VTCGARKGQDREPAGGELESEHDGAGWPKKRGLRGPFQFAESFNIVGSHWDDEGRKQNDYEQHKRRRSCHRRRSPDVAQSCVAETSAFAPLSGRVGM